VDVRFKSAVQEIKARSLIISSCDKSLEIENDFVFVMVGGELPYPLLEKIGIRIIEKAP
jgi:thioredoxin reductase